MDAIQFMEKRRTTSAVPLIFNWGCNISNPTCTGHKYKVNCFWFAPLRGGINRCYHKFKLVSTITKICNNSHCCWNVLLVASTEVINVELITPNCFIISKFIYRLQYPSRAGNKKANLGSNLTTWHLERKSKYWSGIPCPMMLYIRRLASKLGSGGNRW